MRFLTLKLIIQCSGGIEVARDSHISKLATAALLVTPGFISVYLMLQKMEVTSSHSSRDSRKRIS